ncbi:MAG: hypothetical protein L3J13_04760 [Devosiaceae bacterium]|nr:hypothetical protein [Devosiaceae bacterium]
MNKESNSSNSQQENGSGEKAKSTSRPSHIAYQVREGGEEKSFFNRVGSAFAHGDGKGFNLVLDSMPVDGRVTLRTPQERLDAKKNEKTNERTKSNQDHGR